MTGVYTRKQLLDDKGLALGIMPRVKRSSLSLFGNFTIGMTIMCLHREERGIQSIQRSSKGARHALAGIA